MKITHNLIFDTDEQAQEFYIFTIRHFADSKRLFKAPMIYGRTLLCSSRSFTRMDAAGLLDSAPSEDTQ